MPVAELKNDKKKPKVLMHFRVEERIRDRIKKEAERNRRTESDYLRVLVTEIFEPTQEAS